MNQTTDSTEGEGRELASHAVSRAPIQDGEPAIAKDNREIEQETSQEEAAQILRSLRDNAFEGSDEKLAVGLGRPVEEIQNWTNGEGTIDGDVMLKAKAMAAERG